MIGFWALLVLGGMFVWAIQTPCTVLIRLLADRNIRIILRITLLDGLIIRQWEPEISFKKKRKNAFADRFQKNPPLRRLLSRARIQLHFYTRIGTGDAAKTALLAGLIDEIQRNLILWVLAQNRGAEIRCRTTPDFNRKTAIVHYSCMITVKTGHIISIAAAMLHQKGWRNKHER